jgi:ribosome maturation factor RimP
LAKVLDKITNNINKIIVDSGFEMYDISFEKEGKNNFLRIFVDSIDENPVDLEVCVLITKNVNKYLDTEELNVENYMLEVSSPGIIRLLKNRNHYDKQIGNEILVKTYKKLPEFDSKVITGILSGVTESVIILNGIEIPFSEIAKAETTFEF